MIDSQDRTNRTTSSFSSTCTSISGSNRIWSDVSQTVSMTTTKVSTSERLTSRTTTRLILPIVPAAWLPVGQVSPRSAALHDLCLPRQEPRPPADVLNRSDLCSCSPSLTKFSRSLINQRKSISTSTTTLPSTPTSQHNLATMSYLTVNGSRSHQIRRRQHHQHPHHNYYHHCRHTR